MKKFKDLFNNKINDDEYARILDVSEATINRWKKRFNNSS